MTAYQRIADSLRRRLLAGHWSPGQRLPTGREMCRRFAASQITVRRALQILEEEHLIERRQGSGTFVNSAAQRKIPILNADFLSSIRRHAPRLQRRLHSFRWAKIDAELAAPLEVSLGDAVLLATRIDYLHDKPAIYDEGAIPALYADRLGEEELGQLDFLGVWQAVQNIHFEYCKQTIEAARARPPINRLLQVRSGEPLLKETGLLFLADGQAAGLFISYYRHDGFC
ncbi:MAG: GntR family transcriptional regulator, partial [Pirellulales bacterium]|nr:GntR family transcriptional regulator [Pirellulales bacterium]